MPRRQRQEEFVFQQSSMFDDTPIVVQNILDGSINLEPVWFCRPRRLRSSKEEESNKQQQLWQPLRKCDCRKLNRAVAAEQTSTVPVEFGRQTANLLDMTLTYNYSNNNNNNDCQELCRTIWFRKTPDPKAGGYSWQPLSSNIVDSQMVEALYQSIVQCTTAEEASQFILLSNPEWKVSVVKAKGTNEEAVKFWLQPATTTTTTSSSSNHPSYYWTTQAAQSWFSSNGGEQQQQQQQHQERGGGLELQRGYGDYTVPGEDEEVRLGPVSHLCFVIHGIGEALFHQDNGGGSTLQDTVAATRRALQKLQIQQWREECERVEKQNFSSSSSSLSPVIVPMPDPPNRIELIAIEWFEQLHNASTSPFMQSLLRATLPGVPALRSIANDVIVDVLLYMTPQYCQTTLETVTQQMTQHYQTFLKINHGFDDGGKVSLLGHSLGSVICWDLLAILKAQQEQEANNNNTAPPPPGRGGTMTSIPQLSVSSSGLAVENCRRPGSVGSLFRTSTSSSSKDAAASSSSSMVDEGTYGPSTVTPLTELAAIPFEPHATIFLGAPVGLFLTLRGADAVFENLRLQVQPPAVVAPLVGPRCVEEDHSETTSTVNTAEPEEQQEPAPLWSLSPKRPEKPSVSKQIADTMKEKAADTRKRKEILISPFRLPTEKLFNIFHPHDPVAYRVESHLLANTAELAPPAFLGDLRWKTRWKTTFAKSSSSSWTATVTAATMKAFGASAAAAVTENDDGDEEEEPTRGVDAASQKLPSLGSTTEFPLNQLKRVDYELQTAAIDNEYLSALSAHSSYFVNKDVQYFLLSLLGNGGGGKS